MKMFCLNIKTFILAVTALRWVQWSGEGNLMKNKTSDKWCSRQWHFVQEGMLCSVLTCISVETATEFTMNVRSLWQVTKFGLHHFQENASSVHYTGFWEVEILYGHTHKIKTTCALFGKQNTQLRNKKNLQNNMQIKQGTALVSCC